MDGYKEEQKTGSKWNKQTGNRTENFEDAVKIESLRQNS
jgi:hypothetical protein